MSFCFLQASFGFSSFKWRLKVLVLLALFWFRVIECCLTELRFRKPMACWMDGSFMLHFLYFVVHHFRENSILIKITNRSITIRHNIHCLTNLTHVQIYNNAYTNHDQNLLLTYLLWFYAGLDYILASGVYGLKVTTHFLKSIRY